MLKDFKIKKKDFFFFTSYIVFLLYKILSVSTFDDFIGENIIDYIKIGSWFLFIIKIILCNTFDIKSIMVYSFLLLPSIIVRIESGSSEILELVLVIIAAKDIEFQKIAKVTLIETSILCIIIVISSLIGVIPNYEFRRATGKYSKAYGFIYVGKLSSFILNILFLDMYLNENSKKHITLLKSIFYFALCTIVFLLCYVRNQYILSIALIILYTYMVKKNKVNFIKNRVALVCIFPICIAIVWFMVSNFNGNNKIYSKLNEILSTRLSVMNRVYEQSEIKAFGNKIEMNGFNARNENYTYVDSGFISILLRDGYISLAMVSLSYMYMMNMYIKRGNNIAVIWILMVAISAMVDDMLLIQLGFNCIILNLLNIKKEESIMEEKNEDCSCNSYIQQKIFIDGVFDSYFKSNI